jgi:hypothetical protein
LARIRIAEDAMARTRNGLLVAWMVVLGAGVARGQDPRSVDPGSRVRIWSAALRMEERAGTLQEVRGDTLVVHFGWALARERRIPVAAVDSLEVANNLRHQGAMAVAGIAAGLGTGFLVYRNLGPCSAQWDLLGTHRLGCDIGNAGKVLLGGIGGALLGALVAGAIVPERWKRIAPGAIRVSLDLRPGAGVGAGLAVPF